MKLRASSPPMVKKADLRWGCVCLSPVVSVNWIVDELEVLLRSRVKVGCLRLVVFSRLSR
jgi:hypothetical protein